MFTSYETSVHSQKRSPLFPRGSVRPLDRAAPRAQGLGMVGEQSLSQLGMPWGEVTSYRGHTGH